MRSLTTRLIATILLLGLVVGSGFGTLALAIHSLGSVVQKDVQATQVLIAADNLDRSAIDLETGLRGYLLSGNASFLAPYDTATIRYPRLEKQLLTLTAGDPASQQRVRTITQAIYAYELDWAAPLIRNVQTGSQGALVRAQQREATGGGKQRLDQIRALFTSFTASQSVVAAQQRRHAVSRNNLALALALASIGLSALLLLAIAIGVRRTVALPVRRLTATVSRLTHGDLSVRVAEGGASEVGDLTRDFNVMADSLEAQRDELESQRAELEAQQLDLEYSLTAVEQQKERAEMLQRFGERLAGESTVKNVAGVALRQFGDFSRSEVGALYLCDERTGGFDLTAERALDRSVLARTVKEGVGLAGRAIAERRPIQVSYEETSLQLPGLITNRDAAFELHLPLLHGNQTIGVVSLGRLHGEPYTESETDVLAELAERAAVACADALSVRRLGRSARELEMLLESTDEGIYGLDAEGRATFANRAVFELTGYSPEELVGRNVHELLHHTRADGNPYPPSACPMFITLQTKEVCHVSDDVFWRKDGSSFAVEYASRPLLDDAAISGAVVTFSDISVRKLAQLRLDTQYAATRVLAEAESIESALPELLAAICQGFDWQLGVSWAPTSDGSHLRVLAAYAAPGFDEEVQRDLTNDQLGPEEGVAGRAWSRRAIVTRDLEQDPLRSAVPFGLGLRTAIAVPTLTHDHTVLGVAEFFSRERRIADGMMETLDAISAQVAQFILRKRVELESAQMKDEFVSTVSHELRTPLTAIDGWLHVLLEEESGPLTEEQRRFLVTVKRNSDRLMRLVGDLLLTGQIETGNLDLELGDVDIAEVVRETVELTAASADEKQITIDVQADSPTVIRGDRARLVQLVSNLLSNAIKFTPEHGHVQFALSRNNGSIKLTVSDTGVGIPVEDRGRLFERFFRASTSRGVSGTGLGLAISKAIVESHNGTIRVAETTGLGTTFEVELPLVPPKEQNQ